MSDSLPTDAAQVLRDLVSMVKSLAYQDSSLTLWMFAEHWELGIEAGDTADEMIEWEGADLAELLELALADLRALPRAAPILAEEESRDGDELDPFLVLLEECRRRVSAYPLDIAYVPHSRVERAAHGKSRSRLRMKLTSLRASLPLRR